MVKWLVILVVLLPTVVIIKIYEEQALNNKLWSVNFLACLSYYVCGQTWFLAKYLLLWAYETGIV